MKTLFALLAAVAVFALTGAELTDKQKFQPDDLPAALTAQIKPGNVLTFSIAENATTGYLWQGEVLNGNVELNLEHRYAESPMVGVPGEVEVTIKPGDDRPAKVRLFYSRSQVYDPDKHPVAAATLISVNPANFD